MSRGGVPLAAAGGEDNRRAGQLQETSDGLQDHGDDVVLPRVFVVER